MPKEKKGPQVPAELEQRIEHALAEVDAAQLALEATEAASAPLDVRREAHTALRHRFDEADACLREATTIAKARSRRDWAHWRKRLSTLGTRRQMHLFAEMDEQGILRSNSIQAIDTGMSGPDLGEMQHGDSMPLDSPPTYGLDDEAVLHEPIR